MLWASFTSYAKSRMLFVTDSGLIGVSVGDIEIGDALVALSG